VPGHPDLRVAEDLLHDRLVHAHVRVRHGRPSGRPAENASGLVDGRIETRERVHAAAGRGDPGGQAVLGGVVDDRADAPDPTARCFELAEVGLPDPIASVGGSWNTLRRNTARDLTAAVAAWQRAAEVLTELGMSADDINRKLAAVGAG
jgi:hypothetical protein